jgi:choline kinase
MQDIKNAIILTAGLGSRLGRGIPKTLLDLNGKKLIEYQLELLKNVPNVYIVVGYKDDEVINFASKIRNDLIFVRNTNYLQTNTFYSLFLAYNLIKEPFLAFDGDTVMNKENYDLFIQSCAKEKFKKSIIGITEVKSDQPVYAKIKEDEILSFSRVEKEEYEFSGPYYIVDELIRDEKIYIFEYLKTKLPLKYSKVEIYEIDTEIDYQETIRSFK